MLAVYDDPSMVVDRETAELVRAPSRSIAAAAALAATLIGATPQAKAAPPWVDRQLTLPDGDFALDFGVGFGHEGGSPPAPDRGSAGFNAEMAVGLTDRVELGLRTGVRSGGDAERGAIQADTFGRLFDRQTFDAGSDVFANPELRVRGVLVRARAFELGVEGRLVLPLAPGADAGVLFGVPMALHLGPHVRVDFGAYVPLVFQRPTASALLSVPVDLWIQASRRLWLGPMSGLVINPRSGPIPGSPLLPGPGPLPGEASVSLGFGLGYAITHYLDFKAMLLLPAVNRGDPSVFGGGAGIELRVE